MRYFSTFLCLLTACTWVQAQDILVVHRKDGTTQRFANGIHAATVTFWGSPDESQPTEALRPVVNDDDAQPDESWQVTSYEKSDDDEYSVFIAWDGNAPTDLPYSLCLSTQPDVTAERADTVFSIPPSASRSDGFYTAIAIGRGRKGTLRFWTDAHGVDYESDTGVNADFALRHGQTYYYRIAAHIPVLRADGGEDVRTVYGPEYSFRIPDFMGEAGIIPKALAADGVALPSDEAWAVFQAVHFPVGQTSPGTATLDGLWLQWLQTAEGKAQKLATEDIVFDDGTLHLVTIVPDAFYAWAASREVFVSTPEEMESLMIEINGQKCTQCQFALVEDVPAEWQLPTGSYVQVEPIAYPAAANKQSAVVVHTEAVLPGIRYRLRLTLAPGEAPVPFHLYTLGEGQQDKDASVVERENTSTALQLEAATEVPTVITLDDLFKGQGGQRLMLKTNARIPALTRGEQSSVVRIAEVRLTPMTE